ncbi:MAG: ribosomal protein S18-alanine N-acetyltransferase [Hyphomicrobiales bacterium]
MNAARSLRVATPDDAAALARIHAACFARGWPVADIASFASDPLCLCLIAETGGEALGFVLCRRAGPEAEILTIAVHPSGRMQGMGCSLCMEAMARLCALGVKELHLEVGAENQAALALYRALGFERTGIRRGYYRSAGPVSADAITMRVALG